VFLLGLPVSAALGLFTLLAAGLFALLVFELLLPVQRLRMME
jgi:hypothetical protein